MAQCDIFLEKGHPFIQIAHDSFVLEKVRIPRLFKKPLQPKLIFFTLNLRYYIFKYFKLFNSNLILAHCYA